MSTYYEWRDAPRAEYAVIGDPIAHSWSPRLHQAAYRALGLDERYEAIRVPLDEFDAALAHLTSLGYRGLNVTIPLKEAAFAWALSVDAESTPYRALNTLSLADGRGTNTDAPGFLDMLAYLGFPTPPHAVRGTFTATKERVTQGESSPEGAQGVLVSPQGPAPSTQGVLASPQGPAPSAQEVLASPQGPAPSAQEVLASPQGPAPSAQGVLASPQGPAPSAQGVLASTQGPAPSTQEVLSSAQGLSGPHPLTPSPPEWRGGTGSVLILGAGGTARTLAIALQNCGFKVALWNRTRRRAEDLSRDIPGLLVIDEPKAEGCRLIVNATAAGLTGESPEVNWNGVRGGAVAIDAVYASEPTPFMLAARAHGLQAADGRLMLVAQAARSFAWWHGVAPPYDAMLAVIPD